MSSDNETIFEHESYVLVNFSRTHGSPGPLFGSALEQHGTFITLKVSKGVRIHDNNHGYDRYFGSMSGDILEIAFSASQFAELLTTMNVGCGVPGTLRRFQNKGVPTPPATPTETSKIQENFDRRIKDLTGSTKKLEKDIEELLASTELSKKDIEAIRGKVRSLTREVCDNAPYMIESFAEAVEKTVTSAKTEIDSFYTTAVMGAGLKALQDMPTIKAISAGEEEKS